MGDGRLLAVFGGVNFFMRSSEIFFGIYKNSRGVFLGVEVLYEGMIFVLL